MSTKRQYRVMREFKYNGKMLKKGDTWEPAGGLWDDTLVKDEKHVQPILEQDEVDELKASREKLYKSRKRGIHAPVMFSLFTKPIAEKLIDAGYMNGQAVERASDEDLLKIKGIGQKYLEQIREVVQHDNTNHAGGADSAGVPDGQPE